MSEYGPGAEKECRHWRRLVYRVAGRESRSASVCACVYMCVCVQTVCAGAGRLGHVQRGAAPGPGLRGAAPAPRPAVGGKELPAAGGQGAAAGHQGQVREWRHTAYTTYTSSNRDQTRHVYISI